MYKVKMAISYNEEQYNVGDLATLETWPSADVARMVVIGAVELVGVMEPVPETITEVGLDPDPELPPPDDGDGDTEEEDS